MSTDSRVPALGSAMVRVILPFAFAYYLSYLFRTIGALISAPLIAELHLTPANLGLLTAAYFFTFAIAQLPVGIALDRYGPRTIQIVMLPLAAVGAALFAAGQHFGTLAIGRALIGLGSAAALMAGLKAIALVVPKERVALANGVLVMLGALGALSATAPAEIVMDWIDWRALFALLAIATAASAVLIALTARHPRTDATRMPHAAGRLIDIYRDKRFWRLAPLSTGCIGTSFALQGLWAGPWLTDVAGMNQQRMVATLFVMALALCTGALGLGMLANAVRRFGLRPRDLLAIVAVLSIIAQASLASRIHVPPLLPWIVIATAGSATVLSYAALREMFPQELTGRANAALNVMHIGGAFAIQSGLGLILSFWPSVSGHSPAVAYDVALNLNLVPQILALAWFAVGLSVTTPSSLAWYRSRRWAG